MGARVSFAGGKPKVTDGPFIETKEVLGGYWMIQVKSKQEAIEWASRCPASENEVIEIRQVQELSDFPDDVQKAAEKFTEMQTQSRSIPRRDPGEPCCNGDSSESRPFGVSLNVARRTPWSRSSVSSSSC